MHIDDLPDRTQDYLKKIYDLQEWGPGATLSALADQLGLRKSTASEAVKRLVAQGLVEHAPYGDIELSEQGHYLALQMIRRHRMIETFLCDHLGYSLEEVHAEAEKLEHAVSDLFIDRISAAMQHPTRDPHGDPIPAADGSIDAPPTFSLREVEPGTCVRVERISDRDPELLRYLLDHGVTPGVEVEMQPRAFAELAELAISGGARVQLPAANLGAVLCSSVSGSSVPAAD